MLKPTIINVNGRELKIGNYDTEDKTWYIDRDKERHFMRKIESWGLDENMYKFLKNEGMLKVIIRDYNTGETWEIDVEDIENHKRYLHFKNLKGKVDHKTQIFIAEKHWEKS